MSRQFFVFKNRVRTRGKKQRGATLLVGMILLVLITLLVTSAFTQSSTNLKSVGNLQVRTEAIAAANRVIEQLISSNANFKVAPGVPFSPIRVDINNDGVADFSVQPVLTCIQALLASSGSGPSDIELGLTSSNWITAWDIAATVSDIKFGSSVAVEIHEGVKVQLTDAQKKIACP